MTQLKQPIKILHMFGQMVRDGAETRTLEIMRCIDRKQYQLHFCSLSGLSGDLDKEIHDLGGKVHLCKINSSFPWRFRQLLRQNRFDVVHSHVHYFSGLLLRLADKENVPIRICHFRTTDDGQGNNLRRYIQRRLMRNWINTYSTCILAVCQAVMNVAWNTEWRLDRRCQIIYNGLDLSLFPQQSDRCGVLSEFSLPEDCKLYIHVGRLDTQKNHKRLLEIFAEIANDEPMAYLLIVGRGGNELERWLHTRAIDLGIANRIIFTGKRSDIPRLLKAADLLLFPSLWEGLPGVVLEAGAAGTPVLASNLPGINEIASQLPLIRTLSLEIDNKIWAQTASNFSTKASSVKIRQAAAHSFTMSAFNIHDSAEAHCLAWQGRLHAR